MPQASAVAVPSPCISVCRMSESTGLCEGCLRTIDEIAAWSLLDDAQRREGDRRDRPAPGEDRGHVMATVDWYFDFVSPSRTCRASAWRSLGPGRGFAIARCCSRGCSPRTRAQGPAEIDRKRAFTYRFVVWQARRQGIALKMPHEHPFNPLPLLRLAIACDCAPDAVHRIFRFVWRDGRLPDLPIEWAELVNDLRLPDAQRRIDDPEVKAALRRNTEEAIERGVFGVPTIMVGDELFWGADATAMAADYLAQGGRWTDPEYDRVAALPVGAARREAGAGKPRKKS